MGMLPPKAKTAPKKKQAIEDAWPGTTWNPGDEVAEDGGDEVAEDGGAEDFIPVGGAGDEAAPPPPGGGVPRPPPFPPLPEGAELVGVETGRWEGTKIDDAEPRAQGIMVMMMMRTMMMMILSQGLRG